MNKYALICLSVILFGGTQQDMILDIKKRLMAPCCWSGTVYDHGHEELEEEITAMVQAGQTKEAIFEHYVDIYGERILAVPVAQGFNLMAWLAPGIIAVAGLFILVIYLRSPHKSNTISTIADTSDTTIPFDEQIEKELREMD